jgi:putative transcriptional regulator
MLPTACATVSNQLTKGTFLVASRPLLDPNFRETVVLLADYGPSGASGLVINRPSRMTLAELLPGEESLRPRNDTIYIGGPVALDRLILLIRSPSKPADSHPLFDDVYISGSAATLRELTSGNKKTAFHAFMGYAGWGPGQLEGEVQRGNWQILPAEANTIFEQPPRSIWRKLVERSSGEWAFRNRPSDTSDRCVQAVPAAGDTGDLRRLAPTCATVQKGPKERSV